MIPAESRRAMKESQRANGHSEPSQGPKPSLFLAFFGTTEVVP
jgi:hypothetical protein